MNNNFLSESNFQYLINYVFNDIKQKIQYNISADKKYIGILKKLIQTIHTTNINKRVSTEYLNSLVIDKCVPFIINKINKENNSNQLEHIPQLNTSPRPLSTKINNNNSDTNNMDFSNLKLEEDDNIYQKTNIVDNVMGLSSRNEPRVDFSSKMDQYENERNYSNSTNQNQNQNNMSFFVSIFKPCQMAPSRGEMCYFPPSPFPLSVAISPLVIVIIYFGLGMGGVTSGF